MPPVKKPIFNVCLLVLLPLLVVLTVLIMFLTYVEFWKSCNTVPDKDADSDTLIKCAVLQSEEDGKYYEVYELRESHGYIAFCVPEEQLDEIPYMGGSYYPIAYWSGPSQLMDLSQGFRIIEKKHYNIDELEYQSQLSQIRVYDFSAYKGYTQPMVRGPILAVVFLWLAELFAGGFLIILDLIGGLIIFRINRDRKKAWVS